MIAHFYHCWAGGDWHEPAAGHAQRMREAGLYPECVMIGLSGARPQRKEARAWFRDAFPDAEFTEASSGYEAVTLAPLRDWAQQNPGAAVFYAHTKGAANRSPLTRPWIQVMEEALILRWQDALTLLNRRDAVGCFLTESQGRRFFAGNFWWADADYLALLPEPGTKSRLEAEWWLGGGYDPRLLDLCPGFTLTDLERLVFGTGPAPMPLIPGITYMS